MGEIGEQFRTGRRSVWDPGPTRHSGEWLFVDYNARDVYAPLRDEPDLFVKFASLASKDPGTRDGRYDIMLEWIKNYGVLGLVREDNFVSGQRSERGKPLRVLV